MAQHYIVVLKPLRGGGWTAHFPDFEGCRADGTRIEMAINRAKVEISSVLSSLKASGSPAPEPLSFEVLRHDTPWAAERGIDWAAAVICLVEADL